MSTCKFCDITSRLHINNSNFTNYNFYDEVIYETVNFLVIPTLGALIEGYLLIIPKSHMNSMAELSLLQIEEFLDLKKYMSSLLFKKYKYTPISFEHGSSLSCSNISGQCIRHAHIHMLPLKLTEEHKILSLSNMHKFEGLRNLYKFKNQPYLLFINSDEEPYISTDIIPSQYFRKWIAKELNIEQKWDWRNHYFLDNIQKTINSIKCEVN